MSRRKRNTNHLKGNFIGKNRYMMAHPAYRDLKPVARAVLDELLFRFNGSNNGEIHLDVRTAGKLTRCHRDTAGRAFIELAEHGFIKAMRGDMWQAKVAREWQVTCVPMFDRKPSDDWIGWQKGKPVFKVPTRYKKKITIP